MSAPGSLLDLPDEPRRQWRGPIAAAVGGVVVLIAGVIVARTFALGGGTRPWLGVQAVVAIPAMIAVWLLAGPHEWRTRMVAAAMVVGLVLQPLATSGVAASPERLAQTVDHIGLPGEVVSQVLIGNGRCDPACSELRRTVRVEGIAYAKARAQVEGLMRARGFKITMYGHRPGEPERIDAASDDLLAQFELSEIAPAVTRVASVWIVRGPTPKNKVG